VVIDLATEVPLRLLQGPWSDPQETQCPVRREKNWRWAGPAPGPTPGRTPHSELPRTDPICPEPIRSAATARYPLV